GAPVPRGRGAGATRGPIPAPGGPGGVAGHCAQLAVPDPAWQQSAATVAGWPRLTPNPSLRRTAGPAGGPQGSVAHAPATTEFGRSACLGLSAVGKPQRLKQAGSSD